jgi:hypothetical protein
MAGGSSKNQKEWEATKAHHSTRPGSKTGWKINYLMSFQ